MTEIGSYIIATVENYCVENNKKLTQDEIEEVVVSITEHFSDWEETDDIDDDKLAEQVNIRLA